MPDWGDPVRELSQLLHASRASPNEGRPAKLRG